ncbi:MAG: hypothetical protein ABIZ18_06560, partial [Caldimonas sp.]
MASRLGARRGPLVLAALLALAALAVGVPARAADAVDAATSLTGAEGRQAHVRLGFERVKFPGDEHIGLVGTTYLVDVGQDTGLSLGPAVYGAITGRRGGFFTFGGEAAWRTKLIGPLATELGFYVGGGGGGGAPQGGGLMLRPHADLLWVNDGYAFGLSVSKVKFPNGQIDSTQIGLVFDAGTDFNFVPARRLGAPVQSGGRTGIGFDRMAIVLGTYRTSGSVVLNDGSPSPRYIRTLGVRAERGWGRNTYWGVEASGAAQPGVAGYAEYLVTAAVEDSVIAGRVDAGARVAVGMSGGGNVPVGGGALAKASLYGLVRVSDNFAVSLEGGVASSIGAGRFRAETLGVGLVWAFDAPAGGQTAARAVRNDFSFGVEQFNAARRDGSTRLLQADVLKIDRFVTANVFLTGQVHSAVAGGAGGYSAALIGAGWLQPLGSFLHIGVEGLAGASGGGGVDSHGFIGQAQGFVGWQATPAIA